MKRLITSLAILALALSLNAADSADTKSPKAPKAKPYALKTCLVSDEKLDTDPNMKSYSFVHEGQEVKLCCKNCLKDFNKDTAKYLKKMEKSKSKS